MKKHKLDVTYFNENSNKYEDVCIELNQRFLTYDDHNYRIAYMPDEKRTILCRKILTSCSTRGEILTNDYKKLIELISNCSSVGVILTPTFLFDDKAYVCQTIKITVKEFIKKFKSDHNKFENRTELMNNVSTLIYTFAILNDDVYLRFYNLNRHAEGINKL